MAQQTAVEWLIENIQKVNKMDWDIVYIQAKAMEKEQHSNTWDDSRLFDKGCDYIGEQKPFEQYYNETYE